MQVSITRHIDASEPDSNRNHDWRYEYDLIVFSGGDLQVVARSYTDAAEEVSFLRVQSASGVEGFGPGHLALPLVREATLWLQEHGKTRMLWPGGPSGYQVLPEL
jgi:hypothetical protein